MEHSTNNKYVRWAQLYMLNKYKTKNYYEYFETQWHFPCKQWTTSNLMWIWDICVFCCCHCCKLIWLFGYLIIQWCTIEHSGYSFSLLCGDKHEIWMLNCLLFVLVSEKKVDHTINISSYSARCIFESASLSCRIFFSVTSLFERCNFLLSSSCIYRFLAEISRGNKKTFNFLFLSARTRSRTIETWEKWRRPWMHADQTEDGVWWEIILN